MVRVGARHRLVAHGLELVPELERDGRAVEARADVRGRRRRANVDPIGRTIRITTASFTSGGREALQNTSQSVRVIGIAKHRALDGGTIFGPSATSGEGNDGRATNNS